MIFKNYFLIIILLIITLNLSYFFAISIIKSDFEKLNDFIEKYLDILNTMIELIPNVMLNVCSIIQFFTIFLIYFLYL